MAGMFPWPVGTIGPQGQDMTPWAQGQQMWQQRQQQAAQMAQAQAQFDREMALRESSQGFNQKLSELELKAQQDSDIANRNQRAAELKAQERAGEANRGLEQQKLSLDASSMAARQAMEQQRMAMDEEQGQRQYALAAQQLMQRQQAEVMDRAEKAKAKASLDTKAKKMEQSQGQLAQYTATIAERAKNMLARRHEEGFTDFTIESARDQMLAETQRMNAPGDVKLAAQEAIKEWYNGEAKTQATQRLDSEKQAKAKAAEEEAAAVAPLETLAKQVEETKLRAELEKFSKMDPVAAQAELERRERLEDLQDAVALMGQNEMPVPPEIMQELLDLLLKRKAGEGGVKYAPTFNVGARAADMAKAE